MLEKELFTRNRKSLTFLDILNGLENWRLRGLSMERGESVTDLLRHTFVVLSHSFLQQENGTNALGLFECTIEYSLILHLPTRAL